MTSKTKPSSRCTLTRLGNSQKSSCGNQYIMVVIRLDSNAILVEAMKNRTAGEMTYAYQVLVDRLTSARIQPKMHLLDNKCSVDFKKRIKFNKMMYQRISPHDHRWKIAETAIKMFNSLSTMSVLVREKLVAMYSIST